MKCKPIFLRCISLFTAKNQSDGLIQALRLIDLITRGTAMAVTPPFDDGLITYERKVKKTPRFSAHILHLYCNVGDFNVWTSEKVM